MNAYCRRKTRHLRRRCQCGIIRGTQSGCVDTCSELSSAAEGTIVRMRGQTNYKSEKSIAKEASCLLMVAPPGQPRQPYWCMSVVRVVICSILIIAAKQEPSSVVVIAAKQGPSENAVNYKPNNRQLKKRLSWGGGLAY